MQFNFCVSRMYNFLHLTVCISLSDHFIQKVTCAVYPLTSHVFENVGLLASCGRHLGQSLYCSHISVDIVPYILLFYVAVKKFRSKLQRLFAFLCLANRERTSLFMTKREHLLVIKFSNIISISFEVDHFLKSLFPSKYYTVFIRKFNFSFISGKHACIYLSTIYLPGVPFVQISALRRPASMYVELHFPAFLTILFYQIIFIHEFFSILFPGDFKVWLQCLFLVMVISTSFF